MDTNRLRHFVAVADHGGFTAASKAVFVSQPALSLAVKELEAELGTPLFARVGRRVRLTAAGAALLGPARQALRDVETGRAAVEAVAGVLAGSLSLCSLPTLAADPMAGLVGRFRRHHPGVRVDLAAPEDSQDLFDLVEDGACELGLTDALDVPDSLASIDFGSQSLVFIHPPGTDVRRRTTGTAVAVGDETPFVAAPEGTSTRRLLDELLGALGGHPDARGRVGPAGGHHPPGADRCRGRAGARGTRPVRRAVRSRRHPTGSAGGPAAGPRAPGG